MATKLDPKKIRKAAGMNQSEFWGVFGCTQSGGSRYESGRAVPKPVRMLMELASGKATLEQLCSGKLAKKV